MRSRGFVPNLLIVVLLALASGCTVPQVIAPDVLEPEPLVPADSGVVYRNALELGSPACWTLPASEDHIMEKETFVLSYSQSLGSANWVAWHLNAFHYGEASRGSSFRSDPALPEGMYRVRTADYTNSGFDRGHIVRSLERTTTRAVNDETFLMTNIIPQRPDLNRGSWVRFEDHLREIAGEGHEMYVVSGGAGNMGSLKGEGKVTIPASAWKIVVVLDKGVRSLADIVDTGDLYVIAVNMPNQSGIRADDWEVYQTTVDEIEVLAGCDFLTLLPVGIEDFWESRLAF